MNRHLEFKSSEHLSQLSSKPDEIRSDSKLFFSLLLKVLFYILVFIPYLFSAIVLLLFNYPKSAEFWRKLFIEPFVLIKDCMDWFFEAKQTAYLILFLFIFYIIQILFNLTSLLYTYPLDLFSLKFYTFITSIFIHADILHISSNCLALLIFGRIVEKHFKKNLILLFLVCGVIANIISALINLYITQDLYYSLGASGAIAGLIMFAIVLEPWAFTSLFVLPLPIFIIGWLLIWLDLSQITQPSTINHFAHLGGYLSLLLLFLFLEHRQKKKVLGGIMLNIGLLLLLLFVLKTIDLSSLVVQVESAILGLF
jgi:membrane associated rhomboid family serine protease